MVADEDDRESPWDGPDQRGRIFLSREVGHYDDYRKIRALLECIEFSGVDLLDPDDKLAFTERFARAKRAEDRRKRWAGKRAATIAWAAALIGGAIFSSFWPDALSWLRSRL